MNNVESVKIGYSTNDVFEVAAGFRFLDFGVFDDKIKKLAVFDIFHN